VLLERRDRVLRDDELLVELAQREVVSRHLGDERDEDAAPRLLRGEVLGLRRLVETADPSPEVELPPEVDVGGDGFERRVASGRDESRVLLPLPAAARRDLREELGS